MPKFQVKNTFEVPSENAFVLVGEIEGPVGEGDFVRIPVAPGQRINILINRVEFEQTKTDIELHLMAGPNIAGVLRGLELVGRTFDVEDFREGIGGSPGD